MTTSSDQSAKSTQKSDPKWAGGEHWYELTATLCPESKEAFGEWLSDQLQTLEEELSVYATPNSLGESIRR